MRGAGGASNASRPSPRRRITLGRGIAAALAVVLLFFAVTPPGHALVRAAALVPALFPDPPADPLSWVTRAPVKEDVRYSDGRRDLPADLYRPADGARHAAILLSLGVNPVPRDDPTLVRFVSALARDGFVVLVTDQPDLRAFRVDPDEVDGYVGAVAFLRGRADVDPGRIGLVGLSVGASLLAVTAADVRVRDEVRMLNFFGGYDDAREALREVASHSIVVGGERRAWEPDPLAQSIFAHVLIERVDDANDRATLTRALVDGDVLDPWAVAGLGQRARLFYDLFTARDPDRVDALVDALPDDVVAYLRSISPSAVADGLRCQVLVMDDTGDRFIPFVESRRFAGRVGARATYTEFTLFQHVEPNGRLPLPTLVVEVGKVVRHFTLVLRALE